MFTQYPSYQVLICCEHRCAVYGLDKHLEWHHAMPLSLSLRMNRRAYAPGAHLRETLIGCSLSEGPHAQDPLLQRSSLAPTCTRAHN
jgi:hypothetical protein